MVQVVLTPTMLSLLILGGFRAPHTLIFLRRQMLSFSAVGGCCGYSKVLESRGLLILLKLTLVSDEGVYITVVVLKTVTVLRHFQKKVKNLQMEADRLELIARHKFAPSNRPRLFARPMRVQIVLGARRYPAWFTHGRWPVPFRAAGLRGRRNRR